MPDFDRVVLETTGLADPAPIVATLLCEPVVRHHFRLSTVVATIDAVNAERQLVEAEETAKQIAVADRVVITKADLLEDRRVWAVHETVRRLNGTAMILSGAQADDAAMLFAEDAFDPVTKETEVSRWLAHGTGPAGGAFPASRHGTIHTFSIVVDEPLDWTMFGIWLSMLLHRHGDRVLRVKGLLAVKGADTPVAVHGVQHLIHPPVHLERWPTGDRRSRIVFIVRDIEAAAVRRSLAVFHAPAAG